MERDAIDLGKMRIPRLFKIYFIPTLLGMISMSAVTAFDGIFIGHGVGAEGVAAVNIAWAPMMVLMGVGMMLGMGCSVVASIQLARDREKAARYNVTQAIVFSALLLLITAIPVMGFPREFARFLGASESLLPLVKNYMLWIYPSLVFELWLIVGLFVIRLDGAPKLAMWCNIIPGVLNAVLDYIFIFPLGMGLKGAAIATSISYVIGGLIVIGYLAFGARHLRLIRLKLSPKSIRLAMRNIGYQSRIGLSAMLGECTMAQLMLVGNQVFMRWLGDDGVGAFGVACYYCPFLFMIGNAIAQSAQPIISYNYGQNQRERVRKTERLAILTALIGGVLVTTVFILLPKPLVGLFLDTSSHAAGLAIAGLPYFAVAATFYIFNLTAIGYFQSVEKVWPSIVFALLRGIVLLVPSFLIMPRLLGIPGIWMSLAMSEMLTALTIMAYYSVRRHPRFS